MLLFVFCSQPSADKDVIDTTTTTMMNELEIVEKEPDLYVMLMWHQHQPFYTKNDDGYYTRPWVRVHATKDYLDMVELVSDYPEMKATFNLTPVLLRQIEDFSNGAKDLYWYYTEIDADILTPDDKTKLPVIKPDTVFKSIVSPLTEEQFFDNYFQKKAR